MHVGLLVHVLAIVITIQAGIGQEGIRAIPGCCIGTERENGGRYLLFLL
jgi:hypothetical protein